MLKVLAGITFNLALGLVGFSTVFGGEILSFKYNFFLLSKIRRWWVFFFFSLGFEVSH